MKKILFVFLLSLSYLSFANSPAALRTGVWRMVLHSPGGDLPFGLALVKNADSLTYSAFALNGDERLPMDAARMVGDSLHVPMGIFESEIVAKVEGNTLTGYFKRRRRGTEYIVINLHGSWQGTTLTTRFEKVLPTQITVSGKWATTFVTDKGDTTLAVGVFKQQGNQLKGTFLTTTGDYRYLAGSVSGDSLWLSCFDGTHLYLFKAKLINNQLVGKFWSSLVKPEKWVAVRNENAALPDARSLTYLKKGYDRLAFSFPDVTGKKVSIADDRYKNKVVVVQIMGSWCPNCMDETRFLVPFYQKNKQRGLEIIGLCYEKSADLTESSPKILRLKQRLGIDYELLLAGTNDKAEASTTLPMMNAILSFPTTIIIDKTGKVRQIHTGFAGPGTGDYYDKFVEEFGRLMDKLLNE